MMHLVKETMNEDASCIKEDVPGVMEDVYGVKDDVPGVKENVYGVKEDVPGKGDHVGECCSFCPWSSPPPRPSYCPPSRPHLSSEP
jgi:hypothetical protein